MYAELFLVLAILIFWLSCKLDAAPLAFFIMPLLFFYGLTAFPPPARMVTETMMTDTIKTAVFEIKLPHPKNVKISTSRRYSMFLNDIITAEVYDAEGASPSVVISAR